MFKTYITLKDNLTSLVLDLLSNCHKFESFYDH